MHNLMSDSCEWSVHVCKSHVMYPSGNVIGQVPHYELDLDPATSQQGPKLLSN